MKSTLTKEGVDLLEREVKGFVGEDWWVGNQAEDWREHDPDQAALVMGGDPDMVLLDCGHHDCGAQFATALVAMHNRLPALIDIAKDWLYLEAELAGMEHSARAWAKACADSRAELAMLKTRACIQCANPRPHFCFKCRGYSEWRKKEWEHADSK